MSDFHINIVQLFLLFFFLRLSMKTCTKFSHPQTKKVSLYFQSSSSYQKGKRLSFSIRIHTTRNKKLFNICMMNSCLISRMTWTYVSSSLYFQLYFISESLDCVCGRCLTKIFHFHFPRFTHVHSNIYMLKTCYCMLSIEHVDNAKRSDNMHDFLNWKFLK